MTEKRYVKENFYDEYAIKKEDTIIAIVDSGTNANKICNELNTLYEENKRLQGRIQEYEEIIGGYIDENEEIRRKMNAFHEENEQLRDVNAQLVELLSDIGLKTDTALKLLYEK